MGAGLDTETTNTADQSEVVDGTLVTFNGTEVTNGNLTIDVTTTDGAVRVIEDEGSDGEEVRETISVSEMTNTYSDSSTSTFYYRIDVTDIVAATDIQSGGTTDVTLQIIDDTTVDESSWSYQNVTMTVEAAVGYSYYRMDEDHAGDNDDDSFSATPAENKWFGDEPSAEVRTEYTGLNGSQSSVTIELANETATQALDQSVENADGNWVQGVTVDTSQDSLRAYEDTPDNTDGGYAVIDATNNTISLEFGDEFQNRSTVQVIQINVNADWMDRYSTYGFRLAGGS